MEHVATAPKAVQSKGKHHHRRREMPASDRHHCGADAHTDSDDDGIDRQPMSPTSPTSLPPASPPDAFLSPEMRAVSDQWQDGKVIF